MVGEQRYYTGIQGCLSSGELLDICTKGLSGRLIGLTAAKRSAGCEGHGVPAVLWAIEQRANPIAQPPRGSQFVPVDWQQES
jgi:hypothetical protein